jgi:hypothetical protein
MKKILILASCIVFLMAGVADAYFYLDTSPAGGRNVTITDPGGTSDSTAGRFTVNFGPTQATAVSYQAFCVDYATIGWGLSSYDFYMIALPSSTPYKQAAYIFDKYGSSNPALAQAAIWEVIFEGLSSGLGPDATSGRSEDGRCLSPHWFH